MTESVVKPPSPLLERSEDEEKGEVCALCVKMGFWYGGKFYYRNIDQGVFSGERSKMNVVRSKIILWRAIRPFSKLSYLPFRREEKLKQL